MPNLGPWEILDVGGRHRPAVRSKKASPTGTIAAAREVSSAKPWKRTALNATSPSQATKARRPRRIPPRPDSKAAL